MEIFRQKTPADRGAASTAITPFCFLVWWTPLVFSSCFSLQAQATGNEEQQLSLSRTHKWQVLEFSWACSLQHFVLAAPECLLLRAGGRVCWHLASWLSFWRSYLLDVFPPGPWVVFPQSLASDAGISDTMPLCISVESEAFGVLNSNRKKSLGRTDNKTKQTEDKVRCEQKQAVRTELFIS